MSESETAKDVFGGRLNADMLAEKLGHTNYRDLSEINLQSSSIRFTLTLIKIPPSDYVKGTATLNVTIHSLHFLISCFRMVDLTPADLFGNLRSINLEHNNLTSFSGLIFLPNIKVCTACD